MKRLTMGVVALVLLCGLLWLWCVAGAQACPTPVPPEPTSVPEPTTAPPEPTAEPEPTQAPEPTSVPDTPAPEPTAVPPEPTDVPPPVETEEPNPEPTDDIPPTGFTPGPEPTQQPQPTTLPEPTQPPVPTAQPQPTPGHDTKHRDKLTPEAQPEQPPAPMPTMPVLMLPETGAVLQSSAFDRACVCRVAYCWARFVDAPGDWVLLLWGWELRLPDAAELWQAETDWRCGR